MKALLRFYGLIALSALFLIGTGVVSGWGEWFSTSQFYRLQTEAAFKGELRISDSPSSAVHDTVWHNGGVQQVWGLGVPILRLPFEAATRICGGKAFPDRLVFG